MLINVLYSCTIPVRWTSEILATLSPKGARATNPISFPLAPLGERGRGEGVVENLPRLHEVSGFKVSIRLDRAAENARLSRFIWIT
jgi:hypothetical protein